MNSQASSPGGSSGSFIMVVVVLLVLLAVTITLFGEVCFVRAKAETVIAFFFMASSLF